MRESILIAVDVALDDGPFVTSPTWTRIPPGEVRSVTLSQGRRGSLESIEAGRCTIVLNNRDRRFDPGNTASPEYGGGARLIPDRQIRIRTIYAEDAAEVIEYGFFYGHVASWSTEHRNDSLHSPVVIEAIDGLGYLGTRTFTWTSGATTNFVADRFAAILDQAGWPSAWRLVTGASSLDLPTRTYTNANALAALRDLAAATRGTLTVNSNNLVVFYPALSGQVAGTPQALNTFGVSGADLPYVSADFIVDRRDVVTLARITGVSEQTATSALTQLMPREYRATLPLSDAQALSLAQALIARYEVVRPATRRLTVDRLACAAHLTAQGDLGHFRMASRHHGVASYIRLTTAPPVGAPRTSDYLVEGVEHRIEAQPLSWVSTHYLTPREVYA